MADSEVTASLVRDRHPHVMGRPNRSRAAASARRRTSCQVSSEPRVAFTRLFVELAGDLEHLFRRIVRRERRRHAGQVVDLAPVRSSFDDFEFTRRIVDLLHNFHLECGARLHKLRVYETLSDPTGREVCGYLLVRGSVHAHAYALALKKLTGVELEKFLPTPNIPLVRSRSARSIWSSGSHRRLYTFSPSDYQELSGIWGGDDEAALPDDPPGELEVVEGAPDGGKIHNLTGVPSAFTPDYAPEEMFEIASKLYKKSP